MSKNFVPLSSICIEKGLQTGPFGSQLKANEYTSEGIPIVMPKDIEAGRVSTKSIARTSFQKAKQLKKHFIKPGDILFPRRGDLGRIAVASTDNEGWICGTGCLRARIKENISFSYIHQFLMLPQVLRWLETNALGQTMLNLNTEIISELPIVLPPLPEQQRIAEILSTWDKAIEATEKLIANSEAQKKVLMQQLLTGKKRLPGFDGEWNPKTLDALGKTYTGLSGKTKADFGSGKPFVPYKNVFANVELNMSELEFVRLSDGEKQNIVKSGDIIFTTSSETPEEVGMSSAVLTDIGELYLNSFCFGFRIEKQNEFTPSFAKHLFRSAELRRAISSLAQGSTRYNLSKNEFLKINIHLPKRAEQEQIVEVLDAVETVHAKEQMKLTHLKSEKKALMQQLLTGKRRVKIEEEDKNA